MPASLCPAAVLGCVHAPCHCQALFEAPELSLSCLPLNQDQRRHEREFLPVVRPGRQSDIMIRLRTEALKAMPSNSEKTGTSFSQWITMAGAGCLPAESSLVHCSHIPALALGAHAPQDGSASISLLNSFFKALYF